LTNTVNYTIIYIGVKKNMENISGRKVKIKTDKILERGKYSDKFTKFITENKNNTFTAKLDVDNFYTFMYILEEDESTPQWLFWIDDLDLVDKG